MIMAVPTSVRPITGLKMVSPAWLNHACLRFPDVIPALKCQGEASKMAPKE